MQAFYAMRDSLHENASITSIDYDLAAENKEGGLILFTDASEYAWAGVLTQCGKVVAVYGRSFTATEAAWSAFERELYGMQESMKAR